MGKFASNSRLTITLLGLLFLPTMLSAVEVREIDFAHRSFVGARLGVWTGTAGSTAQNDTLEFSKSSLYAEFFYAQRIAPALAAELTVGIFSRGDIKNIVNQNIILGSVNLYPIFLTAKFYPFAAVSHGPVYPYVQGGGGLFYGSRTATDYFSGFAYTSSSKTKLTYTVGGGIDWQISDQLALSANARYIPAKFSIPLAGLRDYSGWEISFGIGYLLGFGKR